MPFDNGELTFYVPKAQAEALYGAVGQTAALKFGEVDLGTWLLVRVDVWEAEDNGRLTLAMADFPSRKGIPTTDSCF